MGHWLRSSCVWVVGATVIVCGGFACGATLLYTHPSNAVRTDAADYTVGLQFTVGDVSLEVSALGMWDMGADGLLGAHQVGLWDGVTQALLGSVTLPAGTAATLVTDPGGSSYRFADLATAVTLAPDRAYRLGAHLNDAEPFYEQGGSALFASDVEGNAQAVYGGTSASLLFPNVLAGSTGYLGPNLLFDAVGGPPPPPPESTQLLDAIAVEASSEENARVKGKTVDRVELSAAPPDTPDGTFPTAVVNFENFWLSTNGDPGPYITWDFGSPVAIGSVHIWNVCFSAPWNALGVDTAGVFASDNNLDWTFIETLDLAMGWSTSGDPGEQFTFGSPFTSRYVKFEVVNFDSAPDSRVGLSEVAFYAFVPEPTWAAFALAGAVGLCHRCRRSSPARDDAPPFPLA